MEGTDAYRNRNGEAETADQRKEKGVYQVQVSEETTVTPAPQAIAPLIDTSAPAKAATGGRFTDPQRIEIAEDGMSAKGTWLSIGGELMGGDMYMGPMIAPGEELPKEMPKPPMPPAGGGEKKEGPPPQKGSGFRIDFAYYAEDFIKDENGKWWILHHHVCDRWTAELDTDFLRNVKSGAKKAREWMTQEKIDAAKGQPKKPGAQPVAPTTYHYELDKDHGIPYFPVPPEPYTTLSEARSFLPQDWTDTYDFMKKFLDEGNL